jgi:hypothetical protein
MQAAAAGCSGYAGTFRRFFKKGNLSISFELIDSKMGS